jgi:Asp-tRNA(Asn)/Glu-tRNA(Gln) amidotransferase C subunit
MCGFGRYGRAMEEARAVMHRLERIEALDREGAEPQLLLAEVRALLREGEVWVRAERDGTDPAAEALERCRLAHDAGAVAV